MLQWADGLLFQCSSSNRKISSSDGIILKSMMRIKFKFYDEIYFFTVHGKRRQMFFNLLKGNVTANENKE